jgi:hypothetical protein
MSIPDSYSPNNPDVQRALAVFHEQLGKATAAWSSIEEGLFEWFRLCTGLEERLARAVYYSARSFEGRRDMLSAAIPFSLCDEKTRTSIRLCIKRARQYSEFRNRISHGHIFYYAGNPPRHVIAEGRALATLFTEQSVVTLEDLKTATINFEELRHLILGFHPDWQHPSVCEQGCLAEIQALPSAANSTEPSPIPQQRPQPPKDPAE